MFNFNYIYIQLYNVCPTKTRSHSAVNVAVHKCISTAFLYTKYRRFRMVFYRHTLYSLIYMSSETIILFYGSGICCVMQCIFPPPISISLASICIISLLGNIFFKISDASSSLISPNAGITTEPFDI